MLYKIIINPYILYSLTWIIVLILYSFHWTYLFPKISSGLFLFVLSTSFISALWGIKKYRRHSFCNYAVVPSYKYYSFNKRITILSTFLFLIEFLVYRNVPLFSYVLGNADAELYKEFGIPFIHVIAVNLVLVSEFFLFQCYVSTKEKKIKNKFIKLFLINFGVLTLLMNRAVLMYVILGSIFIYFVLKRNVAKYMIKITGLLFGVLFLFGMLGNIRNGGDNEKGKQYILRLCEATPEFEKSIVPTELFWPYIYVTSPISNVENTIRRMHPEFSIDNCISLVVNECMPQLISKRLNVEHKGGKLVLDSLNVGSVYMNSYAYLGWMGMLIMFIFMFIFVEVTISFIPKSDVFFLTLLVLIDIIIAFNIFDNMFIFSGIVPAVFVVILLSLLNRKYKYI